MSNREPQTARIVRLTTDGIPGRLTTPDGESLPVRVFDRGGEVLTLVLMLEPGKSLEGGRNQLAKAPTGPIGLAYTSPKGLVRLRGRAVVDDQDHDLVSFFVIGASDVVQRRDYARVDVALPVVLTNHAGEQMKSHVIDISGGGMLLSDPGSLEPGQRLHFRFELPPDQSPVKGVGTVVRAATDGTRGLKFEKISEIDRQRLIRFIFDIQRQALAKLRDARARDRRLR